MPTAPISADDVTDEELNWLPLIAEEEECAAAALLPVQIEEEENSAAPLPMPKQEENSLREGMVTSLDLTLEEHDDDKKPPLPLTVQYEALEEDGERNGSLPPKNSPVVNNLMADRSMRSSTAEAKQPVITDKQPQRTRYPDMVRRVIANTSNPHGVHSLQAIRRDVLELFPETQSKHKASFNSLTLKACKKLVGDGVLIKATPTTFKFAPGYLHLKGLTPHSSNATQSRLSYNGISEMANQSTSAHNKKMREEMVGARWRRNAFLLRNKAFLMPFMPDPRSASDFFDKIEKIISEQPAAKPFQRVIAGRPGVGDTGLEIDYRALPVNEQFAAKVLSRLGQFRLEDTEPGKPVITMSGKGCREYPPLQLDCNYRLTMADAGCFNMKITDDRSTFYGMHVVWPGQRLEVSRDSITRDGTFMLPESNNSMEEADRKDVAIDWKYVYWLERREEVLIKPLWGPCGWFYPNSTAAHDTEIMQQMQETLPSENILAPPPQRHLRITSRTTALRLSTGVFIPHPTSIMKYTQEYAKRGNVPLTNIITFRCIHPISCTPVVVSVTRQFCTDHVYVTIFKKLLRYVLRRNPEGIMVIKEIAPSAVRPTPVRNIIQPPPIPSQAAAATPAADPVVAAAASANTVENVTTATGVNCQPAAPPSPHGHTTMAAPQPMPSEELPALPSTEMRDALLAAAKWAEKAHAPPPATVLKEGTQAMIDYYTGLLDSAANLPVNAVLLSTVEARMNHSVRLLAQERHVKDCSFNASTTVDDTVLVKNNMEDDLIHPSEDVTANALTAESSNVSAAAAAAAAVISSSNSNTSLHHLSSAQAGGVRDEEEDAIPQVEQLNMLDPESTLNGVEILSTPSSIKATLYEHQVQGLSWLMYMYENGMPAILGDQMGLGKTLQSIALMAALKENDIQGPHLVVAPLSVLSNWITELNRFCPSLRLVRFHGPKDERNRIKAEELHDLQEFDVVVTTYEMFAAETTLFQRRFIWRLLVVDEGHRLKNEKSQLSMKLNMVHAYCRILLTGTPIQNNLRELWALLHFMLPDVFPAGSTIKFEEGFDLTKGFCDTNRMEEARGLLSKLMLRRVKDQISIALPPRTEIQILVKLTHVQHTVYKHLLVSQDRSILQAILEADEGGRRGEDNNNNDYCGGQQKGLSTGSNDLDYRRLMNLLMQLRKVCNHPYLLSGEDGYDPSDVDAMVSMSGKLVALDRILPKLKTDGHRVLIFTQFTSMLDILAEFLVARGHDYCRLDGSTNRVQRHLDIRRFNAPASPIFAFLISTRAGGLGINLASADTVILYDSDWNPQSDLQAMERAHRIGQTRPVRVYRLLCRGSIEQRIVSRASKKLFLNALVAEKQQGTIGKDPGGPNAENEPRGMPGIGKREVASMLKFGASAVFAPGKEDISDEELDVLLGRIEVSSSNEAANTVNSECLSGISGQALAESLLMGSAGSMKEESMRKLEGVEYAAKAPTKNGKPSSSFDAPCTEGKRKRSSRTIRVDINEPGLEDGVSVLVDNLENGLQNVVVRPQPSNMKARKWEHQRECLLCGEGNKEEEFVECGYCPRAYHMSCMARAGVRYALTGNLVCPQHRCVGCDRTTAAAGGLLFRCLTCTSAFCEDCLLEDDIESFGRSSIMEALGYHATQVYWIKCERCSESGLNITGGTEENNAAAAATVDTKQQQQFAVSLPDV